MAPLRVAWPSSGVEYDVRLHAIFLAALLVVSCGGDKSQPTSPSPTSQDVQNWILAGQVNDSVTGQPVAGATVTIDRREPLTTDASGRWQIAGSGIAQAQLATAIYATGYVPRETFLTWRREGRQNIAIELIPERAPFALPFYRYLVRNGLEEPGALEAVRRWESNPNFYIYTHNPKTGRSLDPSEIQLLVNTIRETVPQLTGGTLTAGTIETGDSARSQRHGYVNVKIVHEPSEDFCGRAFVGTNPGEIHLNYDNCTTSCRTSAYKIPPTAVAHEVGHALGFWHVDKGLMAAYMSSDCSNTQFSDAERLHARIAYRRPAGNTDPDRDPTNFAATVTDYAPRIACALASR